MKHSTGVDDVMFKIINAARDRLADELRAAGAGQDIAAVVLVGFPLVVVNQQKASAIIMSSPFDTRNLEAFLREAHAMAKKGLEEVADDGAGFVVSGDRRKL